ncbi:MAG TPA: IPT/TIG domain-containing protein [Actinoplanes sp.]
MRASGRAFSLIVASAVGCGAVVGLGAGPAAAAVTDQPTDLLTAGQACVAQAPGPYLSPVRLNDANAVTLQATYSGTPASADATSDFQVWDVAKPGEPQQWSDGLDEDNNRAFIQLEDPSRQLDGVTYAWKVRIEDGGNASAWSDTCYFTIDRTGGDAPKVSSDDYPQGDWDHEYGEVGHPGTFVFSSVSDDTVSYRYRFYSSEAGGDDNWSTVTAAGPARVTWTPPGAGESSVDVYAVDRAGNTSELTYYEFYVAETRPSVFSSAYPDWGTNLDYGVGVPGEFDFTSNITATSFAWRIGDGGPSGTVASPDGRTATAMIAPAEAGSQTLYVRAVTADGATHPERAYTFTVDNAPAVTGDLNQGVIIGSSLNFHFAPRLPGVTAYLYGPNDYDPAHPEKSVVLPAAADGTADLTWTATNDNENVQGLRVQSRGADGTVSISRYLPISVWTAAPSVTRTGGDVLGTTATFTARTDMVSPAKYEITYNGDSTTTRLVPAAADGTVSFQYKTVKRGYTYVSVVAINAAGVRTDVGGTNWTVTDAPVVASTDFPSSGSGRIAPGTFTFKPQQAGVARYEYQLGDSAGTVAAAADGTATLTWTPPDSGYYQLYLYSFTASGDKSMQTIYFFSVAPDPLTVTSVSPASVAKGGVRTITITGTGLHDSDQVTVTPAGGAAIAATVLSTSADHKTTTATVDLTSAAAGKATVAVAPDQWSTPVTLADALTITGSTAIKPVTPPAITGPAAVGSTLKASTGTWDPAGTYTYQWSANGTAISGATGAGYVIPAAQLGKTLTVTVTAARTGYTSAHATSAATTAVVKAAAPRATAAPKVSGTPKAGSTVQATTGTWSPAADSYRYEWRLAGTLLSNTTKSLTLTTAMRGKSLTVTVVAVKAGYNDGRATSAAVTIS